MVPPANEPSGPIAPSTSAPVAVFALLAVLALAAIVFLRALGDESLGYPDADRILMDGVFVRDFIVDFPIGDPVGYTFRYFAQYPALSIGYRPPFFPAIEGLFNLVFGVNQWSSRLALFLFATAGISAWFGMARRHFGTPVAAFSTALWVSAPFVARWGWYTMGEIPVLSMALIAAYCFDRYLDQRSTPWMLASALAVGLTAWTKQTGIVIGLWFFLHLLATGRVLELLRRRETWYAVAVLVVVLAPLALITLWLGKMNIHQSVGASGADAPSRLSWENLSIHLQTLIDLHLTVPVLVLAGAGGVWALLARDRRAIWYAALIAAVFVFFTYVAGKNERYPIFWIPGFCLFAALPLAYVARHRVASLAAGTLLGGVIVYHVGSVLSITPNYATGYKAAAEFAVAQAKSPTIFVDAYNNGYFTYFVRAADPERSVFVLRGDKLLTSASISAKHWLTVHAKDEADILANFDKYGVTVVVVEERDYTGIDIHETLREVLTSERFRLLKRFPVESNRQVSILRGRPDLGGQDLLVYEYLEAKRPSAGTLTLEVPVVGQTITVPYDR